MGAGRLGIRILDFGFWIWGEGGEWREAGGVRIREPEGERERKLGSGRREAGSRRAVDGGRGSEAGGRWKAGGVISLPPVPFHLKPMTES